MKSKNEIYNHCFTKDEQLSVKYLIQVFSADEFYNQFIDNGVYKGKFHNKKRQIFDLHIQELSNRYSYLLFLNQEEFIDENIEKLMSILMYSSKTEKMETGLKKLLGCINRIDNIDRLYNVVFLLVNNNHEKIVKEVLEFSLLSLIEYRYFKYHVKENKEKHYNQAHLQKMYHEIKKFLVSEKDINFHPPIPINIIYYKLFEILLYDFEISEECSIEILNDLFLLKKKRVEPKERAIKRKEIIRDMIESGFCDESQANRFWSMLDRNL